MVEGLRQRIEAAGVEGDSGALAASVVAAMAGAVAISRSISDRRLSDEMLSNARESIKTRLGVGDADLSRGARQ